MLEIKSASKFVRDKFLRVGEANKAESLPLQVLSRDQSAKGMPNILVMWMLLSAIPLAIVTYHFGMSWQLLFAFIFTCGLLILAVNDWTQGLLPDQITLPLLWLGLLISLGNWFCDSRSAILGAVIGYTSFWGLAWIFFKVTKKDGMGQGDFKLLALLGAWLGWQLLPLIVLLASLFGSIAGISFILFKKQSRELPIAFGPYLALGGWLALLYGKNWLQWYQFFLK